MITIEQALNWLNWERRSYLSERYSFWAWRLRKAETPETEKKETAEALIKLTGQSKDPFEQAEVWVHCGAYQAETGLHEEARKSLTNARNVYEIYRDDHRLGVVDWLLYETLQRKEEYKQAFYWAMASRKRFESNVKSYPSHHRWYQDLMVEITATLLQSPQFVYEWLIEIPRGKCRLSERAVQLRDQIRGDWATMTPRQANEKIDLLLEISRDSFASGRNMPDPNGDAEALVFCGLIESARGNRQNAVRFYRSSLARYMPGSHEQVHARWMLGLAQIADPEQHHNAIKNMETCLTDVDNLSVNADHKNRDTDRQWYELQKKGMEQAMSQLVKQSA